MSLFIFPYKTKDIDVFSPLTLHCVKLSHGHVGNIVFVSFPFQFLSIMRKMFPQTCLWELKSNVPLFSEGWG